LEDFFTFYKGFKLVRTNYGIMEALQHGDMEDNTMARVGRPKGKVKNFLVTVALPPGVFHALCVKASAIQAETGLPCKWAQVLRDELSKSLCV
jgi:hypothetical protein